MRHFLFEDPWDEVDLRAIWDRVEGDLGPTWEVRDGGHLWERVVLHDDAEVGTMRASLLHEYIRVDVEALEPDDARHHSRLGARHDRHAMEAKLVHALQRVSRRLRHEVRP